ncbi:hypothetical protein [Glutamicibacter sp. NPDC087344]|uniref:hypothetical protein n=1 Tax=Glutamicibacter sp. NPDC087344 TaxID=3363994 RepID=UPI0037FBDECB
MTPGIIFLGFFLLNSGDIFTRMGILPMKRVEGLKKLSSVLMSGVVTIALVIGSSAAHASENADAADQLVLLERLEEAADPYAELDEMSESDQEALLQEFEEMEVERVAEIFAPNGEISVASAAEAGVLGVASPAYSDIVWSFFEKAACVIHVDLVSCNRAS